MTDGDRSLSVRVLGAAYGMTDPSDIWIVGGYGTLSLRWAAGQPPRRVRRIAFARSGLDRGFHDSDVWH